MYGRAFTAIFCAEYHVALSRERRYSLSFSTVVARSMRLSIPHVPAKGIATRNLEGNQWAFQFCRIA